tara:strand:- start:15684 stop:17234 length:1551 start_codon:yes stop_codon:yes gene_type:complete
MKRVELSKPILDKYKYRTGDRDFAGGNPVTLETKNVLSVWQNAFNVTPKVDGTRYLCIMDGQENKPIPYFIDRGVGKGMRVYQPTDKKGNTPGSMEFPNCILDGELVAEETKKGRTRWIYWVFDILSFKGTMVTHLSFNQRYYILKTLPFTDTDSWLMMLPKPYYNTAFFIDDKDPYLSIIKLFREHCKKLKLQKPVLDGLVLNDTIRPYVKGPWKRCDNVQYKWKPSDEQTIDLEVVKGGKFLDKKKNPYNFILKKNDKEYKLELNKPAGLPTTTKKNSVAELRLTKVHKKNGIDTEFVRWRNDKTANAKLTADSVIYGFLRPVEISDLFSKNPKKIMKYLTKKQLIRVLLKKKLFSAAIKKIVTEKLKNKKDKIIVTFPNKSIPLECIAERGFPSEKIHEDHDSTGEYVVLSPSLKIKKHEGKTWTVDNATEINIDTNFIYNTSVGISPRKLKKIEGLKKKKKTLTKTIFRITGYTNIVFEKDNAKNSGLFYIEAHGGEKAPTLFRLIQMILNL